METSLTDSITNASNAAQEALVVAGQLELSVHEEARENAETLLTLLQETIARLEEASVIARKGHAHFALCPDAFNPFILADIRRGYCRYGVDDGARTVVVLKRIVDEDAELGLPSAEAQLSHWIVVYTISDDTQSDSFILHGHHALTTYKDDEADVKKHTSWLGPLISNCRLRRRLREAVPPPCEVDIKRVAVLVQDALGDKEVKSDVTSRTWVCQNKKFVLDVVSVFALARARSRKLEIPGVGHVKDLVEEDTLSRYLGLESFDLQQ